MVYAARGNLRSPEVLTGAAVQCTAGAADDLRQKPKEPPMAETASKDVVKVASAGTADDLASRGRSSPTWFGRHSQTSETMDR